MKNSFISKNENNEDYLVSYSKRSSVKVAITEIFHLNKKPLTNNKIQSIIKTKYPEFEIRNFINRLNEFSKELKIHQFSHGTWGKLEYLDLDENEILEVTFINTFIENLIKTNLQGKYVNNILKI